MSGKATVKSAPIPLTEEEVIALAKGTKAAANVRRRLRRTGRSTGSAPVASEMAAPPPISRREMAAIRSGRMPAKVRQRISVPSPQPAEPPRDLREGKLAPSAAPPRKAR